MYVVPSLVSVTYLLMARTFFEGIPDSLEESAKLDGCSYFQIYTRIMLPLSKPVIAWWDFTRQSITGMTGLPGHST